MEEGYKVIKRKGNAKISDDGVVDLDTYYQEEGLSEVIKENEIYGITKEEIERNKRNNDLPRLNKNSEEEYKTVKRNNFKSNNHNHTERSFSNNTKNYIYFIGTLFTIFVFILFLSFSDKEKVGNDKVVINENTPPTSTFVTPSEVKYDEDEKVEKAKQELQIKYSEKEDRTLYFIELKERYEEEEANRQITDEEILYFYN